MSDDNENFDEELAFELWLRLMCQCDPCQEILYLDSIDYLIDVNATKWSEQAARAAEQLGWKYENDTIVCASCTHKTGERENVS